MLLNANKLPRHEGGFTLVELMITVLIVTIGLLGLAKLQATAVANSSISRTRALMTYQAESLAGMIRANKSFWLTSGSTATYPAFAVAKDGTITNTGMTAATPSSSCVDAAANCSAANLAYDDMYTWAKAFNDGTAASAFMGAQASIVCVPASGVGACAANPVTPHGYDITLTWDQKQIAVNRSTAGSTTLPVSMVMHVQP
jgi:type IV pilus assembly protein PilV